MNVKVILITALIMLCLLLTPIVSADSEWELLNTGVQVDGGTIPVSMRRGCGTEIPVDEEQCNIPEPDEVCISLTAYWPFNEDGKAVPWNGQADGSPSLTANGFRISPDSKNKVAAAPLMLVGGSVDIMGISANIHDTFGNEVYQHGIFWHDGYNHWVLPVDILSNDSIHYLVCDGFDISKGDMTFDGSPMAKSRVKHREELRAHIYNVTRGGHRIYEYKMNDKHK